MPRKARHSGRFPPYSTLRGLLHHAYGERDADRG
ncbi:MAG: CRISPR-associated protein Cas5 [Prevotella sp.]|nr:CRISPR-associated protein Cas5 [Prevotella sp.]